VGAGGADAGLTAEQACADSAHAQCEKHDACSNGFSNPLRYGDEPTCEARTKANCLALEVAPGTSSTPETTEACATAYATTWTCTEYLDDVLPAGCVATGGKVAMGSPCAFNTQCESTFCALGSTAVCGTCQPPPAVGAPCEVAGDCGHDLACGKAAGATTGTCAAYVAVSGACDDTHPCDARLACVGSVAATMTMGTCMTQGAVVGAACDNSRKTMANCDATLGLACIPTGPGAKGVGSCQAIGLVAGMSICGSIGNPTTMVTDCQAGGLCVKAMASDKTGTCAAPAADGAACDSVAGPPCLTPAKCVPATADGGTAGTCMLPGSVTCM
jgi:hypothetical protein